MAVVMIAASALSACAGVGTQEGGAATYDALAGARAKCVAQGQELTLVPDGDPQKLSDFRCKGK
jgi:hypothetical protein